MNHNLDDRLYILRNSILPHDLRRSLVEADRLFLRDNDNKSEVIVSDIENKCKVRGIDMYKPILIENRD